MKNFFHPIIGLEIHVELSTKSKMFCRCSGAWQDFKPNANTCPVCLGMPGALPYPNKTAIESTIKIAQALNCSINKITHFDRKHYYYPDLAKGYQISQYDEPIGIKGEVTLYVKDSQNKFLKKSFRITRVHLEEDTGKLSHVGADSVVDFNRAGVPLVEIVTEADFRSSDDVKAFLQELHSIILTLGVSTADMEHGSMRLEPNISVRVVTEESMLTKTLTPSDYPKYKVEVKNINSFNFVKKAIDFEVARHTKLLEAGTTPKQETRGYNEASGETVFQRTKENAADYRYFPDPDIPPFEFDEAYIQTIKDSLPLLPINKMEQLQKEYKLKDNEAFILSRDEANFAFFKAVFAKYKTLGGADAQDVANALVNKKLDIALGVDEFAKKLYESKKPVETDVAALKSAITKLVELNPKVIADFKAGRQNAAMFLVGQVMKELKGKADATVVKTAIIEALTKA